MHQLKTKNLTHEVKVAWKSCYPGIVSPFSSKVLLDFVSWQVQFWNLCGGRKIAQFIGRQDDDKLWCYKDWERYSLFSGRLGECSDLMGS